MQNYGGYPDYSLYPSSSALLSSVEFEEAVSMLPTAAYLKLFDLLKGTMADYVYVFWTGWGGSWYVGYPVPEDLVGQIEGMKSPRARILLLSILLTTLDKQSDLISLKKRLETALSDETHGDALYDEYKQKIWLRFDELSAEVGPVVQSAA
jgi:hypothetical protein